MAPTIAVSWSRPTVIATGVVVTASLVTVLSLYVYRKRYSGGSPISSFTKFLRGTIAAAASSSSSNKHKYEVVFVLGGPGSGKGTQCALLVEEYGVVHLSAGDLLREERKRGSEVAAMINTYIKEGKIVPAEVTIGLLRAAMERSGKNKFLIDGFPRNPENLSVWLEKMTDHARIKATLYLNAPEEVMLERLLERSKTSGRDDDNVESIKKRFKVYQDSTMPIIEYFRKEEKLYEVRADRSKDVVYRDVANLFKYHVIFVLGGPGSGKGTNCARIVEDFGYEHLSAGDLLRAERNSKSETADLINNYIKEGKIVPAAITVALLRGAMEKSHTRKFLIDGFPRNMENLDVWKKVMSDVADVKCMLFLECPEEVMESRLLARGRSDDLAATIKKRFRVFVEDTMPIVQSFDKQGKARRVLADRHKDEVYGDVRKVLKEVEANLEALL